MKSTATQLGAAEIKRTFSWVDIVVLLGVFGLLWTILHFGRGMVIHFDESKSFAISTDIRNIPYYAGRTVLRMWLAFGFSLLFTFSVGYAAAKSRVARALILPALDILQSVPVLGFLSITVTGFMALFPGSLLGVECASIFAIFTGQVWNMTFGFYHSLVTIPKDLQEAATNFRLSRWQRFGTLEVPSSMHSLIWNSMMSFGGGWFFVAQSEAITVLNKNIKLPGLGSYMATAVETGDNTAAIWAIVAMLAVILASDQLVWRPLLAWADKFKMELVESGEAPQSWLFTFLRRAYLFDWIEEKVSQPLTDAFIRLRKGMGALDVVPAYPRKVASRWIGLLLASCAGLWLVYQMVLGVVAAADCRLQPCELATVPSPLFPGFVNHGAGRHHDRSRDFDLDADRRLDCLQTECGPHRSAVRANRRFVPGEYDFSVRGRFFCRHPHQHQLGQHSSDRDGHSVVHPLQCDRRCDGDSK